jgi:hypothetical protein
MMECHCSSMAGVIKHFCPHTTLEYDYMRFPIARLNYFLTKRPISDNRLGIGCMVDGGLGTMEATDAPRLTNSSTLAVTTST